jgi:glyoxylase-like metal-dependent hydrolase (beta-lactamase superfamily II)
MVHPPIRVGDVEVVPLCDGWAPLPLSHEAPGHEVDWSAERDAYPWAFDAGDDGNWAWHVHAFLLRLSGGPVLVDCGIGHLGRPTDVAGRIDDELQAAGVSPVNVRHVIHTHLHSDHAGGACRPARRGRQALDAGPSPDVRQGCPSLSSGLERSLGAEEVPARSIVQSTRSWVRASAMTAW